MPVQIANGDELYQKQLETVCGSPAVLDVVQLGLGDDGHTASLVPDDPVCEVIDQDIAISNEYKGRKRITMTRPILERAREQIWLVAGDEKKESVKTLLSGSPTIPANLFDHSRATLMCDHAALPDR